MYCGYYSIGTTIISTVLLLLLVRISVIVILRIIMSITGITTGLAV